MQVGQTSNLWSQDLLGGRRGFWTLLLASQQRMHGRFLVVQDTIRICHNRSEGCCIILCKKGQLRQGTRGHGFLGVESGGRSLSLQITGVIGRARASHVSAIGGNDSSVSSHDYNAPATMDFCKVM
jgi:hypothetical protein